MDVDDVLKGAITALVNGEPVEGLEGIREDLPEGAKLYFDMAMDLLAEGDVGEAEKCLWAARCEALRVKVQDLLKGGSR